MSPCQSPFKRPAAHPSWLTVILAVILLSPFTTTLVADEILQPGPWKGEYEPANLGDGIDASFCVQRDNTSAPPWKITMRLDLPPPGNEPVEFETLESEDESLRFKINLLGALRECFLENKGVDELIFKCKIVDNESGNTERMTMRQVAPSSDDDCQPEATAESK